MKFKFTITLFFLISLVNLKKPQLNLKSFLSIPSDEEDDAKKCELAGTDKNECQAVKLSNNNNQCCFETFTRSEGTENYCALYPFPAKDKADMFKSKQLNALMWDYSAFVLYNPYNPYPYEKEFLDDLKVKGTVSCKDIEFSTNFGYDEYTEADKNIVKSEDYCLNYYFESIFFGFEGKHDCKNGKVLDSSKNAGLECGNIEIKVKMQGETQKMKSCFLYSYDLYSKINSELKEIIIGFYGNQKFDSYDSCTITLSDSNGENRISFDYSNSD